MPGGGFRLMNALSTYLRLMYAVLLSLNARGIKITSSNRAENTLRGDFTLK